MLEYPFKKLEGLRPFFKTFLHRTPPVDPYEVQDVTALCILDSQLPKKMCYLLQWKPFKNDEECYLFQLKNFFYFQDI